MSTSKLTKTLAAAVIAVAGTAGVSHAATVDTVLSLVIDVSGSIDGNEYNLQMDGYANAFRDASIQAGILDTGGGDVGSVAVNVVQYGTSAAEAIAFQVLDSIQDINDFADDLDNLARASVGSSTDIADGLNLGASTIATWLSGAGNSATRQVIDVSGDGEQNTNSPFIANLQAARNGACGAGNIVNGITINTDFPNLDDYYAANVQCGAGSFTLAASGFDTFEGIVKRKLRAEITGTPPIPLPASAFLLVGALGGLAAFKRKSAKKS